MKGLTAWFKKYFVPHKGNDHKPHILRHQSMMVFFLLVVIVELGFLAQVFLVFNKTNFLASVLPGVLTNLTNQERAQNDAPPLTESALLDKAAQMKADDMAKNGYFAHTSPEGKTPWYWFDQVGYHYTMAGENLAVNFFESEDVAKAWMNSPTHRANIVKKEYKEIGIGVAKGKYQGQDTVFVAQLFGTPIAFAASSPEPTPAPVTPVSPIPQKTTPIKTVTPTPKPVINTPPRVLTVAPTSTKVLGEEEVTTVTTAATSKSLVQYIKSFLQRLLTSPRDSAAYFYAAIGVVVVLALFMLLFIKSEIVHMAPLFRGVAILSVVAALLFLNFKVLDLKTEIPTDSVSANVIAY